jgi:hypothetical protein
MTELPSDARIFQLPGILARYIGKHMAMTNDRKVPFTGLYELRQQQIDDLARKETQPKSELLRQAWDFYFNDRQEQSA